MGSICWRVRKRPAGEAHKRSLSEGTSTLVKNLLPARIPVTPRFTPSLAQSGRGQQTPVPGSGPGPKAVPPERVAGSRASDQVWPPPEMLQRRHCRWCSQVTTSAAPGEHRPGRTELRKRECCACACGGGARCFPEPAAPPTAGR